MSNFQAQVGCLFRVAFVYQSSPPSFSGDPGELLRRLRKVSGIFRDASELQKLRRIEAALETMTEMLPVYEKLVVFLERIAALDKVKK